MFIVSKCRPSGTWKMVVVTLSYATDLSKYFVQPRLRYLSYNQCDCSPHRETIKIKESSRICKHRLMEMSSSYVKHKCSFSGRRMGKKHILLDFYDCSEPDQIVIAWPPSAASQNLTTGSRFK